METALIDAEDRLTCARAEVLPGFARPGGTGALGETILAGGPRSRLGNDFPVT